MKKLGLIVNHRKAQAASVLARLVAGTRARGMELYSDAYTVRLMGVGTACETHAICRHVDAVIGLGGDGTMLRVARAVAEQPLPVIGLNIGSLGYLTSVSTQELERALDCLMNDDFSVSDRTMLSGTIQRAAGRKAVLADALNDIVVTRGASGRIVSLDVSIDDVPVTTYVCDGLIVSTPTGSTAYSMSAGGPILMPHTPSVVISVICPHTLSSRPLVVCDAARISIQVRAASAPLLVSVDGQDDHGLVAGDRVDIERSARRMSLIHLPGHNVYSVLRQKLGWSGSSV